MISSFFGVTEKSTVFPLLNSNVAVISSPDLLTSDLFSLLVQVVNRIAPDRKMGRYLKRNFCIKKVPIMIFSGFKPGFNSLLFKPKVWEVSGA